MGVSATGMDKRVNKLSVAGVVTLILFAVASPIWATSGPSPDLAFPLVGARGLCNAVYWRPVEGQPGRAYFLSAGHCWHEGYVAPEGARVVWAKVPGDRPTFMDILVGETGDARSAPAYPQELTETPRAGDTHVLLTARSLGATSRVDSRRLTFKQNLGDAYAYDAEECVSPGYSGAPVFTEGNRLVGIAILGSSKLCTRLYVVPMSVLYEFRPDLRPKLAD